MKKIFVFICLLKFTISYAQNKQNLHPKDIVQKYNKFDQSRLQGFSKSMLPDGMEHFSNYEEGFYYNGKKIGVWYKRNYLHKVYEMEIFYDTSQNKIEHFGYFLENGITKEHGYYLLTAMNRTDTFDYIDPVTNEKKRAIWDSTNMKQGKWNYFYKTEVLKVKEYMKMIKRRAHGNIMMIRVHY